MNYGVQKRSDNIIFDPSVLTIAFNDKVVCSPDKMPVRINGQIMSNINNICFGGNGSIIHAVRFGDLAAIDIEPLGEFSARLGLGDRYEATLTSVPALHLPGRSSFSVPYAA